MADFGKTIGDAYRFEGEAIELGRGVREGEVAQAALRQDDRGLGANLAPWPSRPTAST